MKFGARDGEWRRLDTLAASTPQPKLDMDVEATKASRQRTAISKGSGENEPIHQALSGDVTHDHFPSSDLSERLFHYIIYTTKEYKNVIIKSHSVRITM
jgi:hypothetical protein